MNPHRLAPIAILLLLSGWVAFAQPDEGSDVVADPGGTEHVSVARSIVTVRADPAAWAGPDACSDLRPAEIRLRTGAGTIAAAHVERVSEPAVHWLLVDMSDSTAEGHEGSRQAALRYVEQILRPGLDRAALVTVDEDTLLRQAPTSDPAELRRTLESVPAGNQSLLRDALAEVLLDATGRDEQHVIVYWTDGLDTTGSFHTVEDLRRTLARNRNVTVFPIAIVRPGVNALPAQSANQFLQGVAEASHGTVYFGHDRRWVEGIRGWLHRRSTVTFSPDEPVPIDDSTISTTRRGCTLTVVPTAPAPARRARSGPAGEVPEAWLRAFTSQRRAHRTMTCTPDARGPAATLTAGVDGLEGCALDLVQDRGLLVDGPQEGRFAWRPLSVHTPPLSRIARSPEDVLESLLDLQERGTATEPLLVNGRAVRPLARLIARTLHRSRDEYRAFAAGRIAARAERAMAALAREFRSEFPGLDPALLERAVRESEAARKIRARVEAPTEAQLQELLAAPLGDVPAADLFRRLEERRIMAQLEGRPGAAEAAARTVAGWARLRAPFAVAGSRRVVAPLVPGLSADGERIGFWRIVLPRPSAASLRKVRATAESVPFDLVPAQPAALWVWTRALAARPDLPERLRTAGVRGVTIRYEPLRRPDLEEPLQALLSARVRLRIEVDPAAVSALEAPPLLAAALRLLSRAAPALDAQLVPGGSPDPPPSLSDWIDSLPEAADDEEDEEVEADDASPPRLDLVAEVATSSDGRLVLRSVRARSLRSPTLHRLGRELVRSMRAQLAGDSSTSR